MNKYLKMFHFNIIFIFVIYKIVLLLFYFYFSFISMKYCKKTKVKNNCKNNIMLIALYSYYVAVVQRN